MAGLSKRGGGAFVGAWRRFIKSAGQSLKTAARRVFWAAWRIAASATAARRVAGFVYMNQQLSGGFKTFSSRETQKKCFTEGKINVFSDPPVRVFEKKIGRLIFGWNFF